MKPRHKIAVINGPNLNLLGTREPAVYGRKTLETLAEELTLEAQKLALEILFFQSNYEGKIIDFIHECAKSAMDYLIINPGGFGHTSIALHDAVIGVNIPYIEVHISNIYARESFRHHSYLSAQAAGVLAGFGVAGYRLALQAIAARLKT